jgi:hypothetical protein
MRAVRRVLERGERTVQGENSEIYVVDVRFPRCHIYCVGYNQSIEFTLDSFKKQDMMFIDVIHHLVYRRRVLSPFHRDGHRLVMAINLGVSPNIVPLVASENEMQWWY